MKKCILIESRIYYFLFGQLFDYVESNFIFTFYGSFSAFRSQSFFVDFDKLSQQKKDFRSSRAACNSPSQEPSKNDRRIKFYLNQINQNVIFFGNCEKSCAKIKVSGRSSRTQIIYNISAINSSPLRGFLKINCKAKSFFLNKFIR